MQLEGKSLRSDFVKFVSATAASLMVFSLYSMVDGLLVSLGVNEYAMSAVNLAIPFTNALFSIAVMFAVGTSTIIAIFLAQDKRREADALFSDAMAWAAQYDGDPLDTFAENVAVALQVCDELHLNRNDFLAGMKNYRHDPGALAVFTKGNTVFINGFSINDPESTMAVYEDLQKTYPAEEITILLNSRSDRPFRIDQHVEMVAKMPCAKVLLTGNNRRYVQRQLQKRGVSACPLQRYDRLLQEKYQSSGQRQ